MEVLFCLARGDCGAARPMMHSKEIFDLEEESTFCWRAGE